MINHAYQEPGFVAFLKTQTRIPTDALIKNCRIQLLGPAACRSAAVRAQPALAFIVEPEKAEGPGKAQPGRAGHEKRRSETSGEKRKEEKRKEERRKEYTYSVRDGDTPRVAATNLEYDNNADSEEMEKENEINPNTIFNNFSLFMFVFAFLLCYVFSPVFLSILIR